MFTELHLTNFRKCRDEAMHFGPGLTAIRGGNEASKSTRFEALAYAMFGSDALREPLADVVTWGEKESSLKVVLRMQVNQFKVEIRRGKSGAEIDVDGKLVATGQKEVTRFVEGLLGAPPKVASKLMLANQASLRGALSDGPTATSQLIEQLSNFALIDEVIQLVQDKLPSGSPVALEQQIRTLGDQMTEDNPVPLDLSPQVTEMGSLSAALAAAQERLEKLKQGLPAAKNAADASRANANAYSAALQTLARVSGTLTLTRAQIAQLRPVSAASEDSVGVLRIKVREAADAGAVKAAWQALQNTARPVQEWEGPRVEFDAALKQAGDSLKAATAETHRLHILRTQAVGRLVKETSCAFCGKDLKDVPEVARLNGDLGVQIAGLDAAILTSQDAATSAQEAVSEFLEIARHSRVIDTLYQAHARYIRVLDTGVPAHYVWVGPEVSSAAPPDYTKALREAEAEIARAARDAGQLVALEAQQSRLLAEETEAAAVREELAPLVVVDRSVELEEELQDSVRKAEAGMESLKFSVQRIDAEMSRLQQMYEMKVASCGRLQKSFLLAQTQLGELQLNNVLLKKLRGARPKVADKLWSTVLATVSYYFSQVRGTQSVVTKDDTGFKVDGKPVTGLSGSTLDALGLAIRIALTKTFLPNNDFMILDEPGAACDDERESLMLGTIATAGFAQTLLVTHSGLADAFADQVITL